MHLCCANCSMYPLKTLLGRTEKIKRIKGYWFNPNIEPFEEYNKRLGAMRELERLWELDVIYSDKYDNHLYKSAQNKINAHNGSRCEACYTLRLDRTALKARELKIDAFTTSLLVSPYQKHDLVKKAGELAAKTHGVHFYYEDFRPGWQEGTAISRSLGLYRQNYCGCLVSKAEREEERASLKRQKAEMKALKTAAGAGK